jgi:hypothetical protein
MKQANVKSVFSSMAVWMVTLFTVALFVGANFAGAAEETKNPPATPKARISKVDRTEGRIKELHSTLKITPAQEEFWNALTQVMRDNAKTMEALSKARAEIATTMNAVEDLKSYGQITEANAEGLKKFIPAFEALYNSMSDEQKKNADVLFKMGRHGKSRRR